MKTLKGFLFYVLGVAVGLFTLLLFDQNTERIYVYKLFLKNTKLPLIRLEYGWVGNLVILIVVLLVGVFITLVTRFFLDSKNTDRLQKIHKTLLTVFVGIMLTVPFMRFFSFSVSLLISSRNKSIPSAIANGFLLDLPETYILVYALLFYPFLMAISFLFIKSYEQMLLKPLKNCRLEVCEANALKGFDVIDVLVEKDYFKDCYDYLRNQKDKLKPKQFYRIVEMNWNKSVDVDYWNYHHTGEPVEESEDEFLEKLYLAEYAKDIKWFD